MGCIPAYDGNGNSRNVPCSKPSLHCRKRPWEWALYKWLTKSISDAMHKALYIYIYITFVMFTLLLLLLLLTISGLLRCLKSWRQSATRECCGRKRYNLLHVQGPPGHNYLPKRRSSAGSLQRRSHVVQCDPWEWTKPVSLMIQMTWFPVFKLNTKI